MPDLSSGVDESNVEDPPGPYLGYKSAFRSSKDWEGARSTSDRHSICGEAGARQSGSLVVGSRHLDDFDTWSEKLER